MEEKEREGGKRETERESERDTEGRGMTERASQQLEKERGSRPTTLLLSIYYCLVLVLVPFGFYYFRVPRLSL